MKDYKKGYIAPVSTHLAEITEYLFTIPADDKVCIKVIDGTKAKTLSQNDAINGLIREMYRVGGDSKPEELDPYLETYDIFRGWVKSKVICLFEPYTFVHPKTGEIIKRNGIKSIGDYNLTDGKKAIKTIIAYISKSGMINDTEIQRIINNMEYSR